MKKSEETRARILAAATRLMVKKGPLGVRTADLAAEAGLSEGAIFRYFPTKAHVFEAALRPLLAQFTAELQRVEEAGAGLSEPAVLENIIDFHFSFFTRDENLALIVLGLAEQEGIGEHVQTLIQEVLLPYVARIAALLRRGTEAGAFRPGDPSLMATGLLGLMQVTIFRKVLVGAAYSFAEARAEVKRIFLAGIRTGP